MKKKIKWGLVLCSVLIPVCLSACKQGTVEKHGSSNKDGGILGTVAGANTLLVICRDQHVAKVMEDRLLDLMKDR